MNDVGLFQAIDKHFQSDSVLKSTLTGFYTQPPASVTYPVATLDVLEVRTDSFRPPLTMSVNLHLVILSRYTGVMQIHQLLTRANTLLDGQFLDIVAEDLSFEGQAVFRIQGQEIRLQKDGQTREGRLQYQVFIHKTMQ